MEVAMEEVLRLGRYISEHASFSLVNKLESVAPRIAGAQLVDRGGSSFSPSRRSDLRRLKEALPGWTGSPAGAADRGIVIPGRSGLP
jgi:hypothetical protein